MARPQLLLFPEGVCQNALTLACRSQVRLTCMLCMSRFGNPVENIYMPEAEYASGACHCLFRLGRGGIYIYKKDKNVNNTNIIHLYL